MSKLDYDKINYDRFIQNIIDQIKEAQIKLGYAYETTRLYYPAKSLVKLLKMDLDEIFKDPYFEDTIIGTITISGSKERIEICVSPDGAKYIHEQVETPKFLVDLIHMFQNNHHLTIDEIKSVFEKHGSSYQCEDMKEDSDFDYVLYFSDGKPDSYYYCIKMEMGHTIYHRFTKEDYLELIGVH